jgi:hypothetical protein
MLYVARRPPDAGTRYPLRASSAFGILGSAIAPGTDDVSPLANDGIGATDQVEWRLTALPAAGTVQADDGGAFAWTHTGTGSYTATYLARIWRSGTATSEEQTNTITLGAGGSTAFDATGAASLAGTVTAAGTLALTTAHTLSGAAGISGALSAAGTSTVAVSLSGAAGISGTLSSAGALVSEGQFLITGSAGLSGTVSASGSTAVGTAVALSGAAGLAGTLSAAGAVFADSPANVTGAASVSGSLSAAGAITFEAPAFGGGWMPPRRKRAKREEATEEAPEEAPQIAEEVQEKPKRAPRVFRLKKADTRAAELIEKGRRQARLQAEDELLLLM